MSKYCDYENDSFVECLSKDSELVNGFAECIFPGLKRNRIRKEELNINKNELVKYIKHCKLSKVNKFSVDIELSEKDVKEVCEEYGLYYNYNIEYNNYNFMFKQSIESEGTSCN